MKHVFFILCLFITGLIEAQGVVPYEQLDAMIAHLRSLGYTDQEIRDAAVMGAQDEEDKNTMHNELIAAGFMRRLSETQDTVVSPCAGFQFGDTCPENPGINPDRTTGVYSLSIFARDWIDYTCCQILKEDMTGIISSVWMWLQVCSQTMNTAAYEITVWAYDDMYRKDIMPDLSPRLSYPTGPLKTMLYYCPQDLEGGKLSEWVVATFFPVMEDRNPNFQASTQSFDDCNVGTESTGAVTVLLSAPIETEQARDFGHVAMVVHDDPVALTLPDDHDNTKFVSWSNSANSIGAMITGTKAVHQGFGLDLQNVTETLTLYNIDTAAIKAKWEIIKNSGQMFDLLDHNCGWAVLYLLNEGYKDHCTVEYDELWTPERAFELITKLEPIVNRNDQTEKITAEAIRARHIVAPVKYVRTGIDPTLLIGICLACFFGTLVVATAVATVIIIKIKADASQQLDRNLANLLISAAAAPKNKGFAGLGAIPEGGAANGPPSKKKGKKNSVLPIPMAASIQQEMDVGTTDGTTDYAEFMKWAKEHGFNFKQAKIMWADLDRDHNNHVTNGEWEKYINKRPNLKWLATRLQSVCRQ